MTEEIPIELECWMLKWGVMPREHIPASPDIVWPKKETAIEHAVRTGTSMGWKPSYEGEEPPF